jgi:hypothetical protein
MFMCCGARKFSGVLLALSFGLVGLSGLAQAKEVKLKGAVYSPHPGVICDKKAGFCADSQGIAVALTKMYLGEKAETRLMNMIRPEPGVQDFDTTTFVLTNKVACDCKVKQCKVNKYEDKIDAAHTKLLFGG